MKTYPSHARPISGVTRALSILLLLLALSTFGEPNLPPSHTEISATTLREAIAGDEGHPVVLNAWATWCIPCRKEFPDLVALEKDLRSRGVRFRSVSVDTAEAYERQARPFLTKTGVTFPTWRKTDGDDEAFINALDPTWEGELPAVFLFDRQGKLVKRLSGEHDRDTLRREISALLTSP